MGLGPQTHLERLLAQAHARPTDGKAYVAFVKELVVTMLGALGRDEAHGFQPLALAPSGTSGVCVFTHPLRYDAFTASMMLPQLDWQVRAERPRRLFGWAVQNELFVLLNPGSDLSKDFPPFELDRLLRGQWL
ncbi:hypothetical protein [Micropruina sp.]|uniref:hypothetical protein n=1 Tax=Micropruina sp. TaxID=2737536 RepID=UPI0039E3AA4B